MSAPHRTPDGHEASAYRESALAERTKAGGSAGLDDSRERSAASTPGAALTFAIVDTKIILGVRPLQQRVVERVPNGADERTQGRTRRARRGDERLRGPRRRQPGAMECFADVDVAQA